MNTLLRIIGIRTDFERLFYVNEYKALAGEKRRIILALILILCLTLLALGYAVGSMDNLRSKMDNPFTNWVDLSITEARVSAKAFAIEEDYSSEERKTALQLNDIRGWVMFNLEMYHQDFNPTVHPDDTLAFSNWGRTLDEDDPLITMILSGDNLIWKDEERDWEDGEALAECEIIITQEMMERLGYDAEDPEVGGILIREDSNVIFLNVVGVIRELPRFCNFICSSKLYNIKNAKKDGVKNCYDFAVKNDGSRGGSFSFIADANADAMQLKSLARTFFTNGEPPEVRIAETYKTGNQEWGVCEIDFLPADRPTTDSIFKFVNHAIANQNPIGNLIRLECTTDYCSGLNSGEYHYLAFNFNRLDDVRKFKDDLKKNYDIEVDMSQVEAKENFALVGQLTFVISLILLAFGVLSIILFVNSLLKSHLFKVRPNLGTFKAFGLSNHFLNATYLKIILVFLLLAISFALGLTIIVDRLEQWMLLEESKFNIFDYRVLLAIVLLILISLIISSRTIRKILGDTPGNLIYER